MTGINVAELEPVGEFGSKAWCEACARYGVQLLEDGGLHNIAASLQYPSPEFAGLPTTDLGVPDFEAMSEEQKQRFLGLLAVEV